MLQACLIMTIPSGALSESWEILILLNILWIVCSIPIVTAGAGYNSCVLCDFETGPG